MCLRRCQIENNVNIRVSDQLHTGGVCLGNTVLCRLSLCLLQSARGTRHHLDCVILFQIVQVNIADVANANYTNA